MYDDFLKGIYKQKSTNLTKLGIDWENNPKIEYLKIQSLLYTEYHILCESMLSIMKKYDIPSTRTIDILFRVFDVESRTMSNSLINGYERGRVSLPNKGGFGGKQYWHTTWNDKKVFLRSSYELYYAKKLDEDEIDYDVECLRIKYFDSQKQKYRIAIPDFYLIGKNKIVEIKAKYWYDEKNMFDKQTQYKILGFDFELILDGAPAGIQTPT